MDFLDPKKQKKHAIRIWIGYVLIGTALLLATVILLYQAYGYRITRQGEVIQNGLVFMSSTPVDAAIYANGKSLELTTNSRLSLAAGQYTIELIREGYHTWKRGLTVEGGSVQRFAYPFLFPSDLQTSAVKNYTNNSPTLLTQSPDRKWVLAFTGSNTFDVFDLSQQNVAAQARTMPSDLLSADSTTDSWREVQWSDDNRRVVLQRVFTKNGQQGTEYILYDREQPDASRNLTTLLGFNPTDLTLRDGRFDSYYAFDKNSGVLFTATIDKPTPQPLLRNVLAYESDGNDNIVYVTEKNAGDGKVLVQLYQGQDQKSYTIRQAPKGKRYLVEFARFGNDQMIAVGTNSENKVFVYRNPMDSLRDNQVAVPEHILKATNPAQVTFSTNARFIAIQRGTSFAVYDAETERGYAYEIDLAETASPSLVTWMDGHHMTVINNQKVIVFDYDGTNQHTLVPNKNGFVPLFAPNYQFMFTLGPNNSFNSTALRTAADR